MVKRIASVLVLSWRWFEDKSGCIISQIHGAWTRSVEQSSVGVIHHNFEVYPNVKRRIVLEILDGDVLIVFLDKLSDVICDSSQV